MFNRKGFNRLKFNQSLSINSTPNITIVSYSFSAISDEVECNKCIVVFKSDVNITQWEARADGNGVGQGILVGSGNSLSANTEHSFDIDWNELTNGDKQYKINIYGLNENGWSLYE